MPSAAEIQQRYRQYARGWEGLFLFIALARLVTICKEGAVRLLVWVLRASSYKTKAEA